MFPSAAAVTINKHRAIKNKDKMMEPKSLNYKVYIIGKSIQKRKIVKKILYFLVKVLHSMYSTTSFGKNEM